MSRIGQGHGVIGQEHGVIGQVKDRSRAWGHRQVKDRSRAWGHRTSQGYVKGS